MTKRIEAMRALPPNELAQLTTHVRKEGKGTFKGSYTGYIQTCTPYGKIRWGTKTHRLTRTDAMHDADTMRKEWLKQNVIA